MKTKQYNFILLTIVLTLLPFVHFSQTINQEVKSCIDSSWNYMYSDLDKAHKWAKEAIETSNDLNDKYSLGCAQTNMGIYYDLSGNYDKALNYYYKSLDILESYPTTNNLSILYNNMSICYYTLLDYNKALGFVTKRINAALNSRIPQKWLLPLTTWDYFMNTFQT